MPQPRGATWERRHDPSDHMALPALGAPARPLGDGPDATRTPTRLSRRRRAGTVLRTTT
jgi:hypothetical protein